MRPSPSAVHGNPPPSRLHLGKPRSASLDYSFAPADHEIAYYAWFLRHVCRTNSRRHPTKISMMRLVQRWALSSNGLTCVRGPGRFMLVSVMLMWSDSFDNRRRPGIPASQHPSKLKTCLFVRFASTSSTCLHTTVFHGFSFSLLAAQFLDFLQCTKHL